MYFNSRPGAFSISATKKMLCKPTITQLDIDGADGKHKITLKSAYKEKEGKEYDFDFDSEVEKLHNQRTKEMLEDLEEFVEVYVDGEHIETFFPKSSTEIHDFESFGETLSLIRYKGAYDVVYRGMLIKRNKPYKVEKIPTWFCTLLCVLNLLSIPILFLCDLSMQALIFGVFTLLILCVCGSAMIFIESRSLFSTKKKKYIVSSIWTVICWCVVVSLFMVCSGVHNICVTEISDYGDYTNATSDLLAENFSDSLPVKDTVEKYGTNYYYSSNCAIGGDENFVVFAELKFPDKASYENELNKYTALFGKTALQGDVCHYLIQGSQKEVADYCDDKIYDGKFYDFEIISANENNHMITFTNAHIWDYYNDEVLINYLQSSEIE